MPRNTTQAITLTQKESRAEPIQRRKHCPHISEARILRIQHRHFAGQTNREIVRAEHCGRNTVSTVVKAPELQEHLQGIREKMWGLADSAADVVRESIVQNRDARVAYELLRDVGVLPRASQIVCQPNQSATMAPENAMARQTRLIAAVIAERHRVFGIELPADMKEALERDEAPEAQMSASFDAGINLTQFFGAQVVSEWCRENDEG